MAFWGAHSSYFFFYFSFQFTALVFHRTGSWDTKVLNYFWILFNRQKVLRLKPPDLKVKNNFRLACKIIQFLILDQRSHIGVRSPKKKISGNWNSWSSVKFQNLCINFHKDLSRFMHRTAWSLTLLQFSARFVQLGGWKLETLHNYRFSSGISKFAIPSTFPKIWVYLIIICTLTFAENGPFAHKIAFLVCRSFDPTDLILQTFWSSGTQCCTSSMESTVRGAAYCF